ncbi:MAG: FAD-dependent oxidoreductase [Patescibacteria group bacterium]
MYDLIIIGGGPAGAAAGVYAARKKLKTLLITESFGGQSLVSDDIQNWIGDVSISGFELAKKFETHLKAQEDIEIRKGEQAEKIERADGGFLLTTKKGVYETKTIFLAAGSRRRKLDIPGEKEFEGKGVFYCSICDAPVMKGKKAAVIGGGNSGLEAVIDLIPYAEEIYLLHRNEALKGDAVTQEHIRKSEKVQIILNASPVKVEGEKFVERLAYKDTKTGEEKTLPVEGVFVEIGAVPNSEIVKGLVELNARGEVVVDHKTQQTSLLGIWAAGDVTDVRFKQNNISAGDAIKAILDIHATLSKQ